VSLYDAEIRSMDRAFGTLVDTFKKLGLYDQALIVVTSDHGEEFGEHGRMGWHSHTLFEELLRVPLLVKLPGGARAGNTVEEVARGIDVAPTILRAIGAAVPGTFAGRDLFAAAPPAPEASETFSARDVKEPHEVASVRTPEWKLIQSKLFNLRQDPGEKQDLAEREADMFRRLAERKGELKRSRPRPPRRAAQADEDLQERLRALGYLE
jgi:arylsulfatase A-like enzyme